MRMGRSLPPAAAPIGWADLGHGVIGAFAARASVKARQRSHAAKLIKLTGGEDGYVMRPLDAIATIEDTRIRRYCCPTAYICESCSSQYG